MPRLLSICLGLILVGLLFPGCRLFSPGSGPTPTSSYAFATVTPGATDVSQLASPTALPTLLPTATPIPAVTLPPLVTATSSPANTNTPIVITATPSAGPYAVVNSPNGFLNVRPGPGLDYNPPLGTYNNGAVAEILGKQVNGGGELWWLIKFTSDAADRGWIFADYTVAYNAANVPWVTAPPPPTAVIRTPYPPPGPHAIIDSPDGTLIVRSGPGTNYTPLGTLVNGYTIDIVGKQFAPSGGDLWWQVPFYNSTTGKGWIFANYTIARNTNDVPWVNAPSTPTPGPTATFTPTPTGTAPTNVTWTIIGRVVNSVTNQPVAGASVQAKLGSSGINLLTVADANGNFSLVADAPNGGDLVLNITAGGYVPRTVTAGPITPRSYNFATLQLTPDAPPTLTWAVFGRVTAAGGSGTIPGAAVQAILGDSGLTVNATTDSNGEFSLSGEAGNSGQLTVNISAVGYQPYSFTSPQIDSRIYNLSTLQLTPLAANCNYEWVIDLTEATALARLQTLSFTTVTTTVVPAADPTQAGLVLTQEPAPPPAGSTSPLACDTPIILGVGAG